VFCENSHTLILPVIYDAVTPGAIDTECIVRLGDTWAVFSLKNRDFVYPFTSGAHEIRALPEIRISVKSPVRSLYVVFVHSRWLVHNTANGVTTVIE